MNDCMFRDDFGYCKLSYDRCEYNTGISCPDYEGED